MIARAKQTYIAAYRRMLGASDAITPSVKATERLRARVRTELGKLPTDDLARRGKRLRALARLTRHTSDLALPHEAIAAALAREADAVRRLSLALQAEAASVAAATTKPPLVGVLHAGLKSSLGRMFDLLALRYPTADVRAAEGALMAESPTGRAGALELLDNVVRGSARQEVMDALEPVVLPRRRMAPAREATLASLLELDDPLLRRDVARAARFDGILSAELRELAARDPDPAVRRAAQPSDEPPLGVGLAPGLA